MPEVFEEPKSTFLTGIANTVKSVSPTVWIIAGLFVLGGFVLVQKKVLNAWQFFFVLCVLLVVVFLRGVDEAAGDHLPIDVLLENGVAQVRKIMRDYNMSGDVIFHEPPMCYLVQEDSRPVWFVVYFKYVSRTNRLLCRAFMNPYNGKLQGVYRKSSGLPDDPVFSRSFELVPVPNQKYMEGVGLFERTKSLFGKR